MINNILWICSIQYPLHKTRATTHLKPTRVFISGSYYREANIDGSLKTHGKEYRIEPSIIASHSKEESIIAYNALLDKVQKDWDVTLQAKKDKLNLNKM